MALFRRHSGGPSPAPAAREIAVTTDDLGIARTLVGSYVRGTRDAEMRAAALELSRAGGGPPSMEHVIRTGDVTQVQQPWRWTAAVAHEAARRHDIQLVAEIGMFVIMWTNLRDTLTVTDYVDMLLDQPPVAVAVDIYSVVLASLDGLDPGLVAIEHPRDGELSLGALRHGVASKLLELGDQVPPEVLDLARQTADAP